MLSQEETQMLRTGITKELGGISWIWQKVVGVSVFTVQLFTGPSQHHQLVWGFSMDLTVSSPRTALLMCLHQLSILHQMRAVLLIIFPLAVTNCLMKAT